MNPVTNEGEGLVLDLKRVLKEEKELTRQVDYFWGKLISSVSILYGLFLVYHDDFITTRLDRYLMGANEDIFGWLLILFGIGKLAGVFLHNSLLRAVGIIVLSATWGMLFTVSILWSFGIGYPSDVFLSNGLMLIACLRIAHKGIFNGLD